MPGGDVGTAKKPQRAPEPRWYRRFRFGASIVLMVCILGLIYLFGQTVQSDYSERTKGMVMIGLILAVLLLIWFHDVFLAWYAKRRLKREEQ